ncbi:ABC transporter substrate-binding protein [Kitasatospora purpeofusca]|uniref:ABC transporter substrate-binding protein n=1 Tax=Kitasatospora purpeofusca TaxID=67352 RepID=UPI0030F1E03D
MSARPRWTGAGARRGSGDGILRIGIGAPETLDPATCFDHDGALVLGLLADPLVDHEPATGRLRPAAAERWRVDPDGLGISFDLRPAVRFHDGRASTAEDYVRALSRAVRPETGSRIAHHLSLVDGFDEVRAGRADILRGVEATGSHRLRISLTRPFHEIAAVFSHRMTTAVPSGPVGAEGAFVGTGPYRLVEGGPGAERLVLERFTGYHGGNRAYPRGGAGGPRRIEFLVFSDQGAAYEAWKGRDVDLVEVAGPHSVDARRHGGAYRLTRCASLTYLGFPLQRPPFDDVEVRTAIALGVDRHLLCRRIGQGELVPAEGIVAPLLWGGPTVDNPVGPGFDPRRARRILAERGVRTDRPLPLVCDAGRGNEHWVRLVAAQLRENLGWEAEVRVLERSAYLNWLAQPDSVFRATWVSDYPSVDTMLYPLFHSDSVGGTNYGRYRSPAVDTLMDEARAAADLPTRMARYRAAEAAVHADLPVLPLWHGTMRHLVALDGFALEGVPVDLFGAPSPRMFRERTPWTPPQR